MLKAAWFVFYTELILLIRQSQEWLYPLGFFLIVSALFPLALSPDVSFLQKYMPGCIWIAALLSSFLAVENVFANDIEDGNLEQLVLSQLPLSIIVIAKLSAHWFVTQMPLILLTPLLGICFHLSAISISVLALSLLLGTPILTLLGSQMVALTLGLRQQGVVLGILLLPLCVPVLIFAVNMVQQAQAGFSIRGPMAFLAGLMVLAINLLPWAIAATLRIGMDD